MTTWVALLRGINVGGRNILPMDELRALLEDLGLEDVRTYIQTGNVVFRSESVDEPRRLARRIAAVIEESRGFEPRVLVIEIETLRRALKSNPFPEAESEPKTLHLYFLEAEPEDSDLEALADLARESERFELREDVLYLHAPEGIGRSKLASRAERVLGVSMTGRNWRTATKVAALSED